jgi:protein gp37
MAGFSHIEWTEATWNPVTGCTKISAGCKNCYAERMSYRLQAMGKPQYKNAFKLTLQPDALEIPLMWKKPRVIFVNSMSDLFQEGVGLDYTKRVFEIMNNTPRHTYQILTKRPEIALDYSSQLNWSSNIWMGTSVESPKVLERITSLREIPAKVRFLSVEPLLERIPVLPLRGISWVIVGGESGPGSRPMDPEWVTTIRNRCARYKVPFFFKQWGGTNKKQTGRLLEGKTWDEMPSCS